MTQFNILGKGANKNSYDAIVIGSGWAKHCFRFSDLDFEAKGA